MRGEKKKSSTATHLSTPRLTRPTTHSSTFVSSSTATHLPTSRLTRPTTHSSTFASSSTATLPTKTTLLCLVHGEPIYCYFSVTVQNNETVEDLKRLILKYERFDGMPGSKAWQLKLWIVNIPFDSQDLGKSDVDIMNTLNGQRFLPPNKVGDVFNMQTIEDRIQVIIELPASMEEHTNIVELTRQAFEALTTQNQMFTEVVRQFTKVVERQTKKPTVSLSTMKQTELDELLDKFHLPIITVDIDDYDVDLTRNENTEPFTWDARNENQQADDSNEDDVIKEGYINYLKRNIRVPYGSDFYDTKSKKSLLSLKYDVLPFEISGTTDVVIANKRNAVGRNLARGIQVGFKLKKAIQDSHIPQAIGQLFTANIRSNENVFIVLTDLNDEWIFFWLENRENSLKIKHFRVDLRVAISVIEHALQCTAGFPLVLRINFHDFREHVRVGGVGNVASEGSEGENDGLELFLNRPKVDLEFEDDVANMKDVYDVMTEEEICNWKIKRALRLL
ncbi:9475_t:CDS:2 [Ambispora gerdemannii]|uniref:9475_t:CDS:1 n=1 Tax=Ambispora gerdemannii TaxID=144530 RepID=A0A9N9CB31_9GLOM|nr:9475_t:CDS:2 [Ambispora gerdemannii]